MAGVAGAQPLRGAGDLAAAALCFGWIDSLARGYAKSNLERVQRLIDAGRMRAPGQREIDAAKVDGRWPALP
jgi:uncharacterized protein YdeI (YjbR/CyaY-like superfamily)